MAATVALSVVLIQVPVLARALSLEPLHVDDWAIAAAGSVTVAVLLLLFQVGSLEKESATGVRTSARDIGRQGRRDQSEGSNQASRAAGDMRRP